MHDQKVYRPNEVFYGLETSSISKEELGEYFRQKGIYTHDIKRWAEQCVKAIDSNKEDSDHLKIELRDEREKNKKVERELKIKEKAPAEAAALPVLRKNVHAIWGDQEEEWSVPQTARKP